MRWAPMSYRCAATLAAIALAASLLPGRVLGQEPVEEVRRLPLSQVRLPRGVQQQTKEYTIFREVHLVNRLYQFKIDSPHATYTIYGLPDLVRTLTPSSLPGRLADFAEKTDLNAQAENLSP